MGNGNWAARRASAIFDLVDGRDIYEDRRREGGDPVKAN